MVHQQKKFTLVQTLATAGMFSAISLWYGYMFGRESARRELNGVIETLRASSPDQQPQSTS